MHFEDLPPPPFKIHLTQKNGAEVVTNFKY